MDNTGERTIEIRPSKYSSAKGNSSRKKGSSRVKFADRRMTETTRNETEESESHPKLEVAQSLLVIKT